MLVWFYVPLILLQARFALYLHHTVLVHMTINSPWQDQNWIQCSIESKQGSVQGPHNFMLVYSVPQNDITSFIYALPPNCSTCPATVLVPSELGYYVYAAIPYFITAKVHHHTLRLISSTSTNSDSSSFRFLLSFSLFITLNRHGLPNKLETLLCALVPY